MPRNIITLESMSSPSAPGSGVLKTLAAWGCEALGSEFRSQAISTFKLRQPVKDIATSAQAFAQHSWAVIRIGLTGTPADKIVFQGVCVYVDVEAKANTSSFTYTFQDPWYYLTILCYQQAHAAITGYKNHTPPISGDPSVPVIGDVYISDLFLFQGLATNQNTIIKWSTGEQIHDAIRYAKSQGVPIDGGINGFGGYTGTNTIINFGTLAEPKVNVPIYQAKEMMCSEVILNSLKATPDVVTFFDYSVWPPLLYVKYQADLTPVALPYGND